MGPGPFLGDTVHHNCSSLGFFLHQDALHSCISKGRGTWATIDQELWLLYLYSAPAGSNVQPSSSSHKCYN
jgi:hypothetical protein